MTEEQNIQEHAEMRTDIKMLKNAVWGNQETGQQGMFEMLQEMHDAWVNTKGFFNMGKVMLIVVATVAGILVSIKNLLH